MILVTDSQLLATNKIHKNNKIHNYLENVKIYVNNNNGCSLNDIYTNY